MTDAPPLSWPRHPLTAADMAAVAATRWRTFTRETVIAIAEAWNAGMVTADMAKDLRCKPGSLRVLIGKLTQVGVEMRRAGRETVGERAAAFVRPRSALAEAMAEEQMARLRRVARWDSAARRALELYERGRMA